MDRAERWRHIAHELLEEGSDNSALSRAIDVGLTVLILANVAAAVAETDASLAAAYGPWFTGFEFVSVIIFTVEYALRVWSATAEPQLKRLGPLQGRLRFMARPYAVIDLIAIAPYYLSGLLGLDLRALRALRLLRILKLARYSPALATLGRVLERERQALIAALMLMLILLVLSGTVIHALEREAQPDKFNSAGAGMWWALATLTTVGYGDLTPITPAGRIFGGLVMIFGLGLFALPIAVIASGFQEEIQRRDFSITWGMVARVPVFSELSAADIAEVLRLLTARRYKTGSKIISVGDPADEMFFVVAGEVELKDAEGYYTLGAGDFFGEAAVEADAVRRFSAKASAEAHLLVLERSDLQGLVAERPEMRAAIADGLARRADGARRTGRNTPSGA